MNLYLLIFIIIVVFYIIPYRDRVALCFTDGEKCFTIDQLCIFQYYMDKIKIMMNANSNYTMYIALNIFLVVSSIIYTVMVYIYYEKLKKNYEILLVTLYVLFIVVTLINMYYVPIIPYFIIILIFTLYCVIKPIIIPVILLFFPKAIGFLLKLFGLHYDIISVFILVFLVLMFNFLIFNFDGTNIISTTAALNALADYLARLFTLGFVTYTPLKIMKKTMFDSL